MDYVIPYRKSRSFDKELRYALRSLSNFENLGRVYIVGEKPSWVQNVEHLPMTQTGQKSYNARNAIRIASNSDVSNLYALAADDIFFTTPRQNIGLYHGGSLEEFLKRYNSRFSKSYYTEKLRVTAAALDEDTVHYELHVPFVVNKEKALSLLDNPQYDGMMFRTVYGNLHYKGKGEYAEDVKYYRRTTDDWYKHTPIGYLSSDDMAFNGQVEKYLKYMFPTKSRFEKY